MTHDFVHPVVDAGLGNSAYLVDLGDGRALAVDACRDLRALGAAADKQGLRIAFAADTHLHADFLSGARQLAATRNAEVIASAAGNRGFAHRGLHDGDEVDLGGLRLRALATPGHTDEHLGLLLLDGDAPVGVFTGGSLIVGAAARTDLVAPDRTDELARAQFHSLRRLVRLPDEVAVWPTHGAGSFCSAPPGAERSSTIGHEKATNPLLAIRDESTFVAALTSALGSYPAYFNRLGSINRRGPDVLIEPQLLHQLTADRVRRLADLGAYVIDVRPVAEYAAAHIPGSLSIELRDAFATWLGWLVPENGHVIVVRDAGQDPEEVLAQAAKVGYDDVLGELAGGLSAWRAAGLPTTTTPLVTAAGMSANQVLDIRQESEFLGGHVPGARHVELGALATAAEALPRGPLTVMCSHGERAMTAASILEQERRHDIRVLAGSAGDWALAHDRALETGT
jgi:glyoxylase-like metal-dependent hydrolase (beta-lactamase superfamily II)/rhodanese-related sulfurtransferase